MCFQSNSTPQHYGKQNSSPAGQTTRKYYSFIFNTNNIFNSFSLYHRVFPTTAFYSVLDKANGITREVVRSLAHHKSLVTHLSLYDEIVDVGFVVGTGQLAVKLGFWISAGSRGPNIAVLGQVEIRRSQHFWPGRIADRRQQCQ